MTLQCYFFPVTTLILVGHGLAGLWTADVFRLYGYSLLVVILAIFLGGKFNSHIPSGRFDRFVHAFLIVIGVFLVV